MFSAPEPQHEWLQQLVGEWTVETECDQGPDQPKQKFFGTESFRSLGGLWFVGEGKGQMPDGTPTTTIMTLGYDPAKGRYTGTWIGSMMNFLWIYDGTLDAAGKALTLAANGPKMTQEGNTTGEMGAYRDVIEIVSPTQRFLKSHMLGDDGTWHHFVTAEYTRAK